MIGRVATIPAGAREFLATGALAHLVTINPDGTPHVSLAWAGVHGDVDKVYGVGTWRQAGDGSHDEDEA
jgi:hypothetical protein